MITAEKDISMASPQQNEAHLRIAHTIQEQIMVSGFTEQQRRILDLILRLSWGCGKQVAFIPHQNTFEIVCIRKQHITLHLEFLVTACVIFRQGYFYQINKNFAFWRVTRAVAYTPEKLAKLVGQNLDPELEIPADLGYSPSDIVTENVTPTDKKVTDSVTTPNTEVTKNVTRLKLT